MKETVPKKRLDHLDIARGLAIILVVWAHADQRMDQAFFKTNLELTNQVIYSFHIALFFIISGSLQRRLLERNDLQFMLMRSIRGILVPFLCLSMAFMALNLITPKNLLATPTLYEMLNGIFLFQSSDRAPSGVLWFLFVLFCCSSLTALSYNILKLSIFHILIAAIIIKICSPLVDDIHFLAAGKFARNYVFFVIGIYISSIVNNIRFSYRNYLILLCAIILFIPNFVLIDTYKPFFQIITGVLGSITAIKISNIIARLNPTGINIIKYLGVHSITIFVFHMPFFVFIKQLIYKFDLQRSFIGFGTWVILGCLLPLALGIVLQQIPLCHALLLGRKPTKIIPALTETKK